MGQLTKKKIKQLLEELEVARRESDYGEIARIKATLRNDGVTVENRESDSLLNLVHK